MRKHGKNVVSNPQKDRTLIEKRACNQDVSSMICTSCVQASHFWACFLGLRESGDTHPRKNSTAKGCGHPETNMTSRQLNHRMDWTSQLMAMGGNFPHPDCIMFNRLVTIDRTTLIYSNVFYCASNFFWLPHTHIYIYTQKKTNTFCY